MALQGIEAFNSVIQNKDTIKFKDIIPDINSTGDFTELENVDVILQSIINLFSTTIGSYPFDPEYGCNIYKYIFEPATEKTRLDIKREISSALSRYEGRTKIEFDVKFYKDDKGFLINFTINYQGTKKQVTVPITEELLKTLPPEENQELY